MTNEVPPVPPVPPTPQNAPMGGQPVPPKKKGLSPLAWVGIGCGTIVVLGIIVVVALGGYAIHKVRQAGLDPTMWQKNPTMAAAKLITTMNPDVEVLSTDEDAQTLTLRNKKTGETVTVNWKDIKDGKLKFSDSKGKEATISMKTPDSKSGTGSMEMKSSSGNFKMSVGSDANQLPAWIPKYKDAVPAGVTVISSDKGSTGGYSISVTDSVDDVANFYNDELKGKDFKVSRNDMTMNGKKTVTLYGSTDSGKGMTVIVSTGDDGKTNAAITFSEEKKN